MSDSTPVKNRLIPVGIQMMSAWLVNDGCDRDRERLRLRGRSFTRLCEEVATVQHS